MSKDCTFTLRMSGDKSQALKSLSSRLGISQNALILAFIQVGIESYSNIIALNQEEFHRFLSQKT